VTIYQRTGKQLLGEIDLEDVVNYSDIITLNNINSNDWIVIEAIGPMARYAITNPIFIN